MLCTVKLKLVDPPLAIVRVIGDALTLKSGAGAVIVTVTGTSRVNEPLTARNVIVNVPVAVALFVPMVNVLATAPPLPGALPDGLQAVPVGTYPGGRLIA